MSGSVGGSQASGQVGMGDGQEGEAAASGSSPLTFISQLPAPPVLAAHSG